MKPEQKITVVETLQDLGHHVAMCGDGCNDCGALKVAHTGISLSSAEASVAAPFTSRRQDITCVPSLILEGRATLVSIFAAFKYNVVAMFGALVCVLFHFMIFTEPSDGQYVTIDLVLSTIPCLVLGNTGATDRLVPRPPTRRILSFLPAVSIFSFLILQTVMYWVTLLYLRVQPWFVPYGKTEYIFPPIPSYENTTLILLNFYTYVIGAVVFSQASPYRKPIYTNYILTAYLLASTAMCIFINFYTGDWMLSLLNLVAFPSASFSAMIFLIAVIYAIVTYVWERWWLYGLIQTRLLPWLERTCGPRSPHAKLEAELKQKTSWPPLTEPKDIETDEALGDGGEATEDLEAEVLNSDEASLLIRKLTRRHKFKATVKYRNEVNPGAASLQPEVASVPEPLSVAMATEVQPSDVCSPTSVTFSPPPDSAGYRDPWDSQQQDGNRFQFNQSVRHQIMKGTKGGFSTFKGSVKKRNIDGDVYEAEPYEVIRLTDHTAALPDDVGGEEIYATISETYNGDLQNLNDLSPESENLYQEPVQEQLVEPDRGNDSLRRRTERQKSLMDDVFNYVDELETTEEIIKRRVKFADSEDEGSSSSLTESMNAAWHRISRSSMQPWSPEDMHPTVESIPEDVPLPGPGYVYDVPGPPRPVQGRFPPPRSEGGTSDDLQTLTLSQDAERRESNA